MLEEGLEEPDAESSYSNLVMLMEQEKFSDDMDPQEMSENLQLLRGHTLSRLVDEIFSPFRILSPTHLCPLSPKRKEESSKYINIKYYIYIIIYIIVSRAPER